MPLRRWWHRAQAANWANLADVRRDFPSMDLVKGRNGDLLVFNIGGNDYRLICRIEFGQTPLFILFVGTHAEYDRLNVKDL
jgi:mRNA interferase HigB